MLCIMTSSLPHFLIVGAPRSGTSALNRYLSEHPDVFTPPRKELHFFDRNFHRGLDWYRDHFSGVPSDRIMGESTPAYMGHPRAIERIAATIPEAKLIAILRDPVERAYSHYWWKRARGVESLSFQDAIAAEMAGKPPSGFARTHLYDYIGRGRYFDQLNRVSNYYDREQLLVFLLDDLRVSPQGTYEQMCAFLSIDSTFEPPGLGRTVNQFVRYRSTGLRRISKSLPSVLRKPVNRFNVQPDSYPPLDQATRDRLTALYREDNKRLSAWLDRDLSMWTS
jgi:hypothetical protein